MIPSAAEVRSVQLYIMLYIRLPRAHSLAYTLSVSLSARSILLAAAAIAACAVAVAVAV